MALKFNYYTRIESKSDNTKELLNKLTKFKNIINNKAYGFFHYSDNKEELSKIQDVYHKHLDKKFFIQVGIGGSALGPQTLIDSLCKNFERKFLFLDNIDSDYIHEKLQEITEPKNAVFYIVSKSGGTAETIATFSLLRSWLKFQGIEEKDFNNHFIFCTDPTKGDLRLYCNQYGFDSLEVPPNVGGRFSVQTPVGLLPALFAGIDIEKLLEGMNEIKPSLLTTDTDNNILLQTAERLSLLLTEFGVNQTILMPYSSKLKTLSHWFVQLWGESLGKLKKDGTPTGLTPIPAYGATDQHSQVQLFMEGPSDKCLFMLNIKNRKVDFSLDNNLEFSSANKLHGKTLNQLMEAEFQGTLKALTEANKDHIHIQIDQVDEKDLGSLILFFESLTALMGIYLEVDPFDQPGVEKGKIYAYEYLNSLS